MPSAKPNGCAHPEATLLNARGWGGGGGGSSANPARLPPSTAQGSASSDHSLRSSSPEESGDGFLLRKDSKRRATLHRVLTAEAPGIIAALEESQVGAGCLGGVWGGSAQQLGRGWAWRQPLSISLAHPEHGGCEVGLGASRPAAELPAELHPVPQPAPAAPGAPGTAEPAAGRGAEPPPPPGSPLRLPGSGEWPGWSGRVLSGRCPGAGDALARRCPFQVRRVLRQHHIKPHWMFALDDAVSQAVQAAFTVLVRGGWHRGTAGTHVWVGGGRGWLAWGGVGDFGTLGKGYEGGASTGAALAGPSSPFCPRCSPSGTSLCPSLPLLPQTWD